MDSLELQRAADDLAQKLDGADRLLVWALRSKINEQEERLATIRAAAKD